MRAVILILIILVVAIIAAIATGLVSIDQTRPAQVPEIDTTGNGVSASGGQAPAFDVATGSISVGAREQNVTVPVPTVDIEPPGQQPESNEQEPATNAQ